MIHAMVELSQAEGYYGVALSGDGFETAFQFSGTPSEIRALLTSIRRQLNSEERAYHEMMRESDAARVAYGEQPVHLPCNVCAAAPSADGRGETADR